MKDCQTMKSAKLKLTEGIKCPPLIFDYPAVWQWIDCIYGGFTSTGLLW